MENSLWQRGVLVFPGILANFGYLLLPGCSEMASTDREEVGVFPFSDPSLCSITALMGSEVPGADVSPGISAGVSGRSCHLALSCRNRFEGLVHELSLEFCATGLNHGQLD